MDSAAIAWLLEDDNPAVQYRTRTELLHEHADKKTVISWISRFLPADWQERQGIWSTHWLTAIAECGLLYSDVSMDASKIHSYYEQNPFDCTCSDFMRLRAYARLGLDIPALLLQTMREKQLPDGGFLCLQRLNRLGRIPKSCYKANLHALLLASECKKRGMSVDFEEGLLSYFWSHRIFYRTGSPEMLILDAREGWRTVDTFHPFEAMRVGLHNVVEAFCALGYGNDPRLDEAWALMDRKRGAQGKYALEGTLTKSYLPREKAGKPSKWVTFYALLAQQERNAVS